MLCWIILLLLSLYYVVITNIPFVFTIVQPCRQYVVYFQCLKELRERPICLVPIKSRTEHISVAPVETVPLSLSPSDAFHESL